MTVIQGYRNVEAALRNTTLRQALYDEAWILMRDVLVNLHGEEHRARRNLETKIFRRDFFKYYEQEVFPHTLAETLAPSLAIGRADLVDLGYRIMLNLTADFTGIDRSVKAGPAKTTDDTTRLLAHLRSFSKAATLGQTPLDRAPIRDEIAQAIIDYDRDFHSPSVARRRAMIAAQAHGELSEDDLPRDLLTVLLRDEDHLNLAPDALVRETAYFLMAGAQSSVHSVSHIIHEIFTWTAAHPEDRARMDSDPIFLQRVVHEAIRLRPSSPSAWRHGTTAASVAGQDIAPEQSLTIDIMGANRDATVFGEDAAGFNPHRPLPGNTAPYGVSFGLGMHACLGRNLAVGVPPRGETDPATHHYGVIPLIIAELLRHDIAPDPAEAPEMDTQTGRPNWGRYPVLFRKS